MLRRSAMLVLSVGALLSGCATVYPQVSVRHFGTMDPDRDEGASRAANAAATLERQGGATPRVEMIAGEMPEGLLLQENGTKIAIQPGAESKYKVLGEVEADYNQLATQMVWRNLWWTWSYDETWRKAVCYPQVPLKIVTLGIWSYLSPTAWPCWANVPGDESDRQRALLRVMKHGVAAMGGDLAIVTESGTTNVVTVTGNNYSATGVVQQVKNTSLKGFSIKKE
jgi:hypothetical protein